MDGYLKIGCTSGSTGADVYERMKQLDSTGVPRAFHCEYAAVVENHQRVEQTLHVAFGDFRVRQSREFFEGVDVFRVKAVLKLLERKDVTTDVLDQERDEPAEKERKPRRESFRFSMVGISPGEYLEWGDDPEIKCEVADERTRVIFKGESYSISGLAKELKQSKYSVAGPLYWRFQEETLQQRRDRIEQESYGDYE